MTQQEYNDYIAHGGKWGYTNGVPNGKKKAAKKYMNNVGKYINRVGESIGDAFKERLSFNGALEVQNKNVKRALRRATSNPKRYRPNQKKEPVNTEVVELNGNLYEVKVSNRSAKAAEEKYKQIQKAAEKADRGVSIASKRFRKNQDEVINSYGAEKLRDTWKKYNPAEVELLLRANAGRKHKARTNEIIKKAQEVDKLRYPNKKNKKKR